MKGETKQNRKVWPERKNEVPSKPFNFALIRYADVLFFFLASTVEHSMLSRAERAVLATIPISICFHNIQLVITLPSLFPHRKEVKRQKNYLWGWVGLIW